MRWKEFNIEKPHQKRMGLALRGTIQSISTTTAVFKSVAVDCLKLLTLFGYHADVETDRANRKIGKSFFVVLRIR